jgi:hypothetical protein
VLFNTGAPPSTGVVALAHGHDVTLREPSRQGNTFLTWDFSPGERFLSRD